MKSIDANLHFLDRLLKCLKFGGCWFSRKWYVQVVVFLFDFQSVVKNSELLG